MIVIMIFHIRFFSIRYMDDDHHNDGSFSNKYIDHAAAAAAAAETARYHGQFRHNAEIKKKPCQQSLL